MVLASICRTCWTLNVLSTRFSPISIIDTLNNGLGKLIRRSNRPLVSSEREMSLASLLAHCHDLISHLLKGRGRLWKMSRTSPHHGFQEAVVGHRQNIYDNLEAFHLDLMSDVGYASVNQFVNISLCNCPNINHNWGELVTGTMWCVYTSWLLLDKSLYISLEVGSIACFLPFPSEQMLRQSFYLGIMWQGLYQLRC